MWTQLFTYDQLNRIKTGATLVGTHADQFKSTYSYDANGNIKTLERWNKVGAKIDEFSYNYEDKRSGHLANTNRLRSVDDKPTLTVISGEDLDDQEIDNYKYDDIGNLNRDNQEGIANIEWTIYGKIKAINRVSDPVTKLPTGLKPHLIFEYDASGNRVSKISIDKTGKVLKTLYLRDASGNVMSTYKTNTSIFLALGEQYLFGSARLGMIDNRGRSYELTDHLGNVRAVVEENKTVASATDYYPFGMVAEQYALSGGYRFGFNGKEKEDEGTGGGGSTYDYGMRIYNGNIARFLSTDPLTSKYPWYTPYQFAGNKPISHIDLDGLEEAKPKYNLTGNLVIALKDDEQVYNQAENTSGSWDIIYVNNLSEASTWLKENYGEKKLDNLVVVSHGTRPDRSYGPGFLLEHDNSQLKNSTEDAAAKKGKLAVNDKDFKNYNTEPTGDLLQDEKNKQVGYIKDINSYVSENGKVLYAECWLGKNKALVEEISKTLPQNAQLYTTELATNTFSGKAVASDPAFLKIGQPITLGMPYGYNDPKNDIQVSKVQTQPSWNVTTNKGKNSVELDKKKKTDLQLSKDGKIEEVNINKK